MFSNLFLQKPENITVQIDKDEHIFRNQRSVQGLIDTLLTSQLSKSELTVDRVWTEVVQKNKHKPAIGYRPLKKVMSSCYYHLYKKLRTKRLI